MKIGEFSRNNKLSHDTVRLYIKQGLLLPLKIGAHYIFDDRCQKDIDFIIETKKLGFKLSEIKRFLLIDRTCRLTTNKEIAYVKEIYKDRQQQVSQHLKALKTIQQKLVKRIDELDSEAESQSDFIGVNIGLCKLFACPECGKELQLNATQIVHNSIIEGEMICRCGKKIEIKRGIIHYESIFGDSLFDSIAAMGYSDIDYMKNTDETFLRTMILSREWLCSKICFEDLAYKNIVELGTGVGFFLSGICSFLPETANYFAIDHDIDSLLIVKKVLEAKGLGKNVVLICTDFSKIPLRDESIDYLIDFYGSSNYFAQSSGFPLTEISRLYGSRTGLFGTYAYFNRFGAKNPISVENRTYYIKDSIFDALSLAGFSTLCKEELGSTDKGGKFENYIPDGEEMHYLGYCGERNG